MRTSHKIWLKGLVAGLLIVLISPLARSSFSKPQTPDSAEVPVVKGGAGSCTADFVVKDSAGKGIYKAKIEIQIKYRFMGFHSLDATTPTNFEGKARFEGLPDKIKKTAEFQVSYGDQSKSVPFDPQADCHAQHEVILGEK